MDHAWVSILSRQRLGFPPQYPRRELTCCPFRLVGHRSVPTAELLLQRGEQAGYVQRHRSRFRTRAKVMAIQAIAEFAEPAEDVVHEALGVTNLLVTGPSRGLEAGVSKFLAKNPQRYAVLQSQ